ncbi:beta-N-acetylhexosaminidase [Synchytrium microbalum]|uniref:beta-N-acetylhexosaminidase n=1 Tax=Synchytrium microbalum TaxID=1806994 RepID=A0A507BNP1_9FUNG|nr:beta-N-acetylhexosaminidase [Synchytrium microbalum]TPX31690.1 beta-N-acetylhexosaminidase [Synchytrium microbalum]
MVPLHAPASENPLHIIPIPASTKLHGDYDDGNGFSGFSLSSNTVIYHHSHDLASCAARLSRTLNCSNSVHYAAGESDKIKSSRTSNFTDINSQVLPHGIHLILLLPPSNRDNHNTAHNNPKDDEAYELSVVDANTITIVACGAAGVFYGCTTLDQMLSTAATIPRVTIMDFPKVEWRGCHLDCSRHFMEIDFIKRFLEVLAYHKINRFHWHLIDDQGWRLESLSYPNLTEIGAWRDDAENPGNKYGGYYTHDQVREVLALAQNLHIEVIPEIELPGHCTAALASYPDLGCTGGPYKVANRWGIYEDVFCAGNENVFTFLESVLSEVAELFPSKYVHIGGDECPKTRWDGCPRCQKRIVDNDLANCEELQGWFVKRVASILRKKGKVVIGWDEIHEGGLPEGAVVQSWRDWSGAIDAVRLGHQSITSPVSHCYYDWGIKYINLEKVYSFDPVPRGLSAEEEALILGSEACMWTEFATRKDVFGKVFPRLLALSTKMWTPRSTTDLISFSDFFETVTMYHIPRLKKMGVEVSDGMCDSLKARP